MAGKCANCKFAEDDGDGWVLCRRYPPIVVDPWNGGEANDSGLGRFPLVDAASWCGEYQKMKET